MLKFKYLSYFFFLALFISISSCSKEDLEEKNVLNDSVFDEETKLLSNSSYEVSESLLCKYLRFFKKDKVVDFIKPMDKNGDVLAYYVKYKNNNGWDVIAADTRLTPLLASCDEGSLDLNDLKNPAVQAVVGMINSVQDFCSMTLVNQSQQALWDFLKSTLSRNVNTKGCLERDTSIYSSRAFGTGMWIPIDTTLEITHDVVPKLTTTAWGQEAPWYTWTPFANYNHDQCVVGCGPVAAGQLIYKYVAANPTQSDTIPTFAIKPNNLVDPVTFSQFSSTAWTDIVLNSSYLNIDQTAIFLSWLGQRMGAIYGLNRTSVDSVSLKQVLHSYLNFTSGNPLNNNSSSTVKNIFCNTLISSLEEGSPIMIGGHGNDDYHVYLVDYFKRDKEEIVITYSFDPNYAYTIEEYEKGDPWTFQWPANSGDHGDFEDIEIRTILLDATYLKMNWGFQNENTITNYNNISYLVRGTSQDIYLSWLVNGLTFNAIDFWFHHFERIGND